MITKRFEPVKLHELADHSGQTFWYLCSPYARYVEGKKEAFKEANSSAAVLIAAGIPVLSPLSHSHPIAKQCNIDPDNYDIWLGLDIQLLRGSHGILINPLQGWRDSKGIGMELDEANKLGLPIYMLDLHW